MIYLSGLVSIPKSRSILRYQVSSSLAFRSTRSSFIICPRQTTKGAGSTKEGWPLLISIRLLGLLIWASTAVWLWRPGLFAWASVAIPLEVQWIGATFFAGTVVWLVAMFHSLGRNITDTVVTRQDAQFVERGPYRVVRNPMYLGVLMLGVSLGLALGTWLLPVLAGLMFLLFALRTRTEEKYLIQRFGETYLDYMARVGRFFPKLPR